MVVLILTPSPEQIREDLEEILRGLGYLAPGRIEGNGSMRPLLDFIEVLAIVLLFCILLYVVFLVINRFHPSTREKPSQMKREEEKKKEEETLRKQDYASLYRRSVTLARKAEYAEAVRVLYIALLILLDAKKIVSYDSSLTNFEYRKRVRPYPFGPLFEKVTRVFDTIFYGGKRATDTDFSLLEEAFTIMEDGLS